jgi:hypothetical protein
MRSQTKLSAIFLYASLCFFYVGFFIPSETLAGSAELYVKMEKLEKDAPASFFQKFSKLKIKKISDPSLQKVGELISDYEELLNAYHLAKKKDPHFDSSQILLRRIIKWTLDSSEMGAPYESLDSFYDLIWSNAETDYKNLIRDMVKKNPDLPRDKLKFFYQRMDEQKNHHE